MPLLKEIQRPTAVQACYTRYAVVCPLADTLHIANADCKRRRNLVPAHMASFGEWEVIAYVAVWAKEAARFPNKSKHGSFTPSRAEIEQWLREQGVP